MKIDILVPQYNETDEIIKPLLDSIAIQQNVDFNDICVIICNDGSDVFLSNELLSSYPYQVRYFKECHRGVSGTRNACLNRSEADYVMFCDADDMFCNVCGLWIVFKEMKIGFDVLVSSFMEETRTLETREVAYIMRDTDGIFVHGKVYRRQYLLDNDIHWKENLTVHEDSYFNALCQNLSKNVKYCPTQFYLWRWRDESVCRHDPKYILKTYKNLIDSNEALIDEFISRHMNDKVDFYVVFMAFEAYYTMNKPEWINQENLEYRNDTEKRFAQWYRKYEAIWRAVPIKKKMVISNGVRTRSVNEGMIMEKMTIDGWLKRMKKLAKDE